MLLISRLSEDLLEPAVLLSYGTENPVVHSILSTNVDQLDSTSLTRTIHTTNRLLVLCRTPRLVEEDNPVSSSEIDTLRTQCECGKKYLLLLLPPRAILIPQRVTLFFIHISRHVQMTDTLLD